MTLLRDKHQQETEGSTGAAATAMRPPSVGYAAPAKLTGRPLAQRAMSGPAGNALTILAPIRDGDAKRELTAYLEQHGTDLRASKDFRVGELEGVHFMRWCVLELGPASALLAFESNYDGTLEDHLAELERTCGAGLRKAYGYCVDSPSAGGATCSKGDLLAWLSRHAVLHAAFHVAHHRRTVARILAENAVRTAIETWLDGQPRGALAGRAPRAVYSDIVANIPADLMTAIKSAPIELPRSTPRWVFGVMLGGVALATAPLSLALLAGFFGWNYWRERNDPPESDKPDRDEVLKLAAREDHQVQNQLTHLVTIKPGKLRMTTLKVVLGGIGFLAKRTYTKSYLGSMATIHFARWVFLDRERDLRGADPRLLFFSNYDGSWESYLGDFVDKAAMGLTAIWSNTRGFPRTLFLLGKGARNEDEFKDWTRLYQQKTQLWFSAYKDLSVDNIRHNAAICEGLRSTGPSDEQIERWLALL